MAEDNDTERTEDPTQKRLDDAHAKGDVAKSQEVNTWFVIAGATLVLSTFSGTMGSGILVPMRNLIANSWMIRTDGHGLLQLAQHIEYALIAAIGVPFLMLMLAAIAGNMIQHRLVWSGESLKPKLSKISPGAGFKRVFGKQAAANFLQGPVQGDCARRGHDRGAVAGAASPRGDGAARSGGDHGRDHRPHHAAAGRRRRHARRGRDRRLLLPVPAMVRASEDDAAGDEGGVQAVGRRSPRQGPHPAVAPGADEEAHDGAGARRPASSSPTRPTIRWRCPTTAAWRRRSASPRASTISRSRSGRSPREHDIPIVENVPLARALYATVEIDEEIPVEHYHAVAEIIGYVMRLKRGFSSRL